MTLSYRQFNLDQLNHFLKSSLVTNEQGIDSLEDVGCFGLTELGYGNNAVQMETTATYDDKTNEFIVNTPSTVAQKYWITNGACDAHHIIVFAQLYINGKNEGEQSIPDLHAAVIKAIPGGWVG